MSLLLLSEFSALSAPLQKENTDELFTVVAIEQEAYLGFKGIPAGP